MSGWETENSLTWCGGSGRGEGKVGSRDGEGGNNGSEERIGSKEDWEA